ncbi:hypothetical protein IWQ60_007881 [Tieghemiomyces parasiticus]|uniref:F-box domain-containing protein n=1 Tax=Tieghemiomyces parasiticus TaxID=78921 RepID=A0A9W8DTF4_9FUNG|nr:hypothetical protein IWQ60_007881 [Tieghemiomyces parasiticus]
MKNTTTFFVNKCKSLKQIWHSKKGGLGLGPDQDLDRLEAVAEGDENAIPSHAVGDDDGQLTSDSEADDRMSGDEADQAEHLVTPMGGSSGTSSLGRGRTRHGAADTAPRRAPYLLPNGSFDSATPATGPELDAHWHQLYHNATIPHFATLPRHPPVYPYHGSTTPTPGPSTPAPPVDSAMTTPSSLYRTQRPSNPAYESTTPIRSRTYSGSTSGGLMSGWDRSDPFPTDATTALGNPGRSVIRPPHSHYYCHHPQLSLAPGSTPRTGIGSSSGGAGGTAGVHTVDATRRKSKCRVTSSGSFSQPGPNKVRVKGHNETIKGRFLMSRSLEDIHGYLRHRHSLPSLLPLFQRHGSSKSKRHVSEPGLGTNAVLPIDFLRELPTELSLHVLSHLDAASLNRAALVSRYWRQLTLDALLWKQAFQRQASWKHTYGFTPGTRPRRHAACQATGEWEADSQATIPSSSRPFPTLAPGTPLSELAPSWEAPITTPADHPELAAHHVPPPSLNYFGEMTSTFASSSQLTHQSSAFSLTGGGSCLAPAQEPSVAMDYQLATPPDSGASPLSIRMNVDSPLPASPCGMTVDDKFPEMRPWRHMYQQRHRLEQRWAENGPKIVHYLNGHTDSVYCLQFHDNLLVTGSRDRSIKFWDLDHEYYCTRTLTGHEGSVLCLKYDARQLVTGSSDHTVRLWDMHGPTPDGANDQSSMRLRGHVAGVLDVAMNDTAVVSCSKDCTIKMWDRVTGELMRSIPAHRRPVNAIQLSGRQMVSASGDGLVNLWDVETGQQVRSFAGHLSGLACVQFRDNRVLSGSNDKSIKVWDPRTPDCVATLTGHQDLVRTLHYAGGDRLVSGSYDQTVKIWDLANLKCNLSLDNGHSSWVFDVRCDLTRLISAGQDQKILVWDFAPDLNENLLVA